MSQPETRGEDDMGTDIHLFVEYQNGDGTWRAAKSPAPTLEWKDLDRARKENDEATIALHKKWDSWRTTDYHDDDGLFPIRKWYDARNYDVFAVLADVRNGRGFAGVDTGDGFNPIAPPRGEPADMSPEVQKAKSWDHTPSWLLLSEVLGFDWSQVVTHRGVIPVRDRDESYPNKYSISFETWRNGPRKRPSSYSGSISGGNIVTLSERDAIRLLEGRLNVAGHKLPETFNPEPVDAKLMEMAPFLFQPRYVNVDDKTQFYVQVSWQETYRECVSDFLEFCEVVQSLNLSSPDRVRFVFGFDS